MTAEHSARYAMGDAIGSGLGGAGGSITISGGKVTAIAGLPVYEQGMTGGGAGIGSTGGSVTITGGIIEASGYDGAGIGGKQNQNGGSVTISGGVVTASSCTGAGIGGGWGGQGGELTISGGVVNAGSDRSAGIGDSANGSGLITFLDWTNAGDRITSSGYSGAVILKSPFTLDETGIFATPENLGEGTLIPAPDALGIRFDSAGGSPVSFQLLNSGEIPRKPADPVRTGHVFKGWFAPGAGANANQGRVILTWTGESDSIKASSVVGNDVSVGYMAAEDVSYNRPLCLAGETFPDGSPVIATKANLAGKRLVPCPLPMRDGEFVWESGGFRLPAALTGLMAGAFAGIGAVSVDLPEEVAAVPSRVFADCGNLRRAYIRCADANVDADAFEGCHDLIVYVHDGDVQGCLTAAARPDDAVLFCTIEDTNYYLKVLELLERPFD